MREHLANSDRLLSALAKLRPHLGDTRAERQPGTLHRVEHAGGGEALGRGPDEHQRLGRPRMGACRIAPSALHGEKLLVTAPDGKCGADFGATLKIRFERLARPLQTVGTHSLSATA